MARVYWYKNHLSSITALLNIIFLCRAVTAIERRDTLAYLDGFFYLLSIIVIYFANSVIGYFLFIGLHLFVFCAWLWGRVHSRLKARHYYVILGVSLLGIALVLSNLDIVFGLFNRNTTLTGRVGLWEYLLKDVVSQRPWWGHGFGAVWTFESFRESVRQGVGWYSPPLIAYNGFLEILLHLGIVGLLIFLSILVVAAVRSFRFALSRKTLEDFFPAIVIFFALIANIAFSLFAETEVFVWLLIVAVLFMTTPSLTPAAIGLNGNTNVSAAS